ncbi:MAG: hypothetical protein PHD68_10740 [Rugosibacter sp.]|nr:hypothetical protein [Rugosibacter sp.]
MNDNNSEEKTSENAAEKYLAEQKSAISSMVVGAKDLNACRITKVFARGDEYVIYEVADLSQIESLKICIYTKIEDDTIPIKNFQQIKDSFDRLKSIMYRTGADQSYKQRAASAIVTALLGNVDESKNLFKNIETDATEDYKHRIFGRLFYLLGAVVITALLCVLALAAYTCRTWEFFTQNKQLSSLLYVMAYAALGGLFSVSLKAKEVFAQRAIAYWMYSIYGGERLIFSIVAGVSSFTLIHSGIIFTTFTGGASGIYFILSIAFLSGFSETLIPNYMGKLEKTHHEKP